jgi:hypothetical protein
MKEIKKCIRMLEVSVGIQQITLQMATVGRVPELEATK